MSGFLLLLLVYAVVFVIVVWPLHWMLHLFLRKDRYDLRFYRQPSYWRLYFWVFGTAMLITFSANILRGWFS